MNPLTTRSIFAPFLVCTTVAWVTIKWAKFVDEVGSTVFYKNYCWEFATSRSITKADRPSNFTIFHCRMSTIQPAWPVCTTSVRWNTRCWHFCSCSSHKTIPPLGGVTFIQVQSTIAFDQSEHSLYFDYLDLMIIIFNFFTQIYLERQRKRSALENHWHIHPLHRVQSQTSDFIFMLLLIIVIKWNFKTE